MHIPVTNAPLPFTPLTTNKLVVPGPFTVQITPVTMDDTDQLGYELFRHNIYPVSQETWRATMIDEIFSIYDEAEAEETANLLDEFWQGEDTFQGELEQWLLQEQQRRFDIAHGAKGLEQAPMPQRVVAMRRRHRAQLRANDILAASPKMRDLSIEMQTFSARSRSGIARMLIAGWSGASTEYEFVGGIVPEAVYKALGREIGKSAIKEIEEFVGQLGGISEIERGNSDLPLEKGSDLIGLPEQSGASEISDGSLTASSSEPVPTSASEETIEALSTSTSASTGETRSHGAIPTEAG
jgi:hypothetical protein